MNNEKVQNILRFFTSFGVLYPSRRKRHKPYLPC